MKNFIIALFGFSCLAAPAAAQDQLLSALTDLELGFWDAHVADDRTYFEANLSDDAIMISSEGVTVGKAAVIDLTFSCDAEDFELEDWALHPVSDDVAIVTFEAEYTLTCDGARVGFEVVVSSTYALRNGRWLNVSYQETVEDDN